MNALEVNELKQQINKLEAGSCKGIQGFTQSYQHVGNEHIDLVADQGC